MRSHNETFIYLLIYLYQIIQDVLIIMITNCYNNYLTISYH